MRKKLLILGVLLTLASGIYMFLLWQEQKLWGHWPLVFFLSAWLTWVLFRWERYTGHPKGLRWLGLSTASGVLLAAAFPPLPLTMLLFVAWVPLLLVEDEVAQAKETSAEGGKKPRLLPYVYHAFVMWNVLATWWVANTAFFAGIVAIWLNAFFMMVPFWLFSITKRVLPRTTWFAFIAYWISFEMLHLHWEITWPWLNLGNAFAEFPQWVQWYEYTGTFGGTLWVLLANVLLFFLLRQIQTRGLAGGWWRWPAIKIAALILVPIGVSLAMYFNYEEKGREVEVLVVQPNYEPHYEKFNIPEPVQIENFMQLTEGAITPDTRYIVYPETSFNTGNIHVLERNRNIERFNRMMARHPEAVLVTGIGAYKVLRTGEPHTRATRKRGKGDKLIYWEAYNAAVQLRDGQDSIPIYFKSKLVPGAEVLPYPKIFFFLKPLADKLGGSLEGLGTQPDREVFESPYGKVAPVICYESIFGDYLAGYVRNGAEAIFIMTNDGWWDNTAGHKQHLKYATLRAIETRRPVARSANTGVSCFINQRGDILQPTKYGEKAAISGTINFNDELTFYVKWGDLIGRIGVFATVLLLLNTLVRGHLQKKNYDDKGVKILSK